MLVRVVSKKTRYRRLRSFTSSDTAQYDLYSYNFHEGVISFFGKTVTLATYQAFQRSVRNPVLNLENFTRN